jgi:hypothetical protein
MADLSIRITVEVGDLFDVKVDDGIIEQWIEARLEDARNHFISNASGPSPSAPGAWPGLVTGRLIGSVHTEAGGRQGEIKSEVEYSGYLQHGTSKMAPRKMLPDALDESLSANPEADELARAVTFTGGGG